jgi:phosphoribosylglycinamide formyltransferase-1
MARDAAIGAALERAGVELGLMAGYDQLLRLPYFGAFSGRTINIHPSLLPAHGGSGMVGMAVHRAVLAAGDAETGVTIHDVTAELDAGPILAQERVPVLAGDDAATLATRVLAVEHRLLVATLAAIAAQRR